MNLRKTALIAVVAAIMAGAFAAPALAIHSYSPVTIIYPDIPIQAWVTFQNDIKTRNIESGWVDPNKLHHWSGTYLSGSYYYVRFEFKSSDASRKTLCDTRARFFEPNKEGSISPPIIRGYYKNGHCYIEAPDRKFPY